MMRPPPDGSLTIDKSSVGGKNRLDSEVKRRGGLNSVRVKSINYCTLSELPVIGDKIRRKKDNMVRIYFENINGIRSHTKGVDMGKYFASLLDKLEIDCFGAAETNLQLEMTRTSPRKLLDLSQDTKTSYACNENELMTSK